ncbi:MAG: response regulator transcription factor [Chitinophagaceae bacterium]|nr:response regulator transcription factor [Chitinophagaceae bacterium]
MSDLQTPVSLLIADDHQMIIDGIKSMLSGERHFVVNGEANNGEDAWSRIAADPGRCQVLLTDISMPLMSGTELCRKVKEQYPHIKVLFLSMYNSTAVVKEAVLAEADGYILKNTGKDELLSALHRISQDGTYFSQEIVPLLYRQYHKEQQQSAETAQLSAREKEVLALIVKECTSEEIAQKLFISKKTVDTHRAHLLEKSKARSTVGLVRFAIKNGLAEW